jgi:putative phage-type endonuclease
MIATTPEAAEAFHAERRTRIGASDVPAIIGLSPRATQLDVWLEKTGRLEPEPDRGKDAAHSGNRLEPSVLDEAETVLGRMERDVRVRADWLDFPLAATLDGLLIDTQEPVNAKTTGINGPVYGHWGEAGTDEVPPYYLAQSLVEQYCTRAPQGHIFALIGGRGFAAYPIPFDGELADEIVERCRRFWLDYVETDREPPVTAPAPLEIYARRRREAESELRLRPDEQAHGEAARIFADFVAANRAKLEWEKREKLAKAALVHQFHDAELLTIEGVGVASYLSITTRRKAQPASESSYRKLCIKSNQLGVNDGE